MKHMITRSRTMHGMSVMIPHRFSDYERETLIHGAHCFAHLLNRGEELTAPEMVERISLYYDPTNERTAEVIRVMELTQL